MEDTLHGSSTAIPRIAAQKLCGFHAEFLRISSNFVKFLVTSTVLVPDSLSNCNRLRLSSWPANSPCMQPAVRVSSSLRRYKNSMVNPEVSGITFLISKVALKANEVVSDGLSWLDVFVLSHANIAEASGDCLLEKSSEDPVSICKLIRFLFGVRSGDSRVMGHQLIPLPG